MLQNPSSLSFQRLLGDSELSYFLPSRRDGVNDMYLHLGFKAPDFVVNPHRLALVWAILRIRHPLLASSIVAPSANYEAVAFKYSPPPSPTHALDDAFLTLEISNKTKDALIDSYLNGPRILSNDRLSYLVLSCCHAASLPTPPRTPSTQQGFDFTVVPPSHEDFDLLICAAHFIGDGMALHTFANDLFRLLAGQEVTSGKLLADSELYELLTREWAARWDLFESKEIHMLPPALESRLPKPRSTFQRIAQNLEFEISQDRSLGYHTFPCQDSILNRKRRTIVLTASFDRGETDTILSRCKKEGVSISHLLFSICNNAWIQVGKPEQRLPMMMYSALNLRPYLPLLPDTCSSQLSESYWFLAVGYFNVTLPSFPAHSVFHRARLAKRQCIAAAKDQLLLSKTRCMARRRSVNAQKFAAMDDRAEVTKAPRGSTTPSMETEVRPSQSPSKALLGLSLLGNLDGIYRHDDYSSLTLHTLTTGSRQRPGGLLVFGYTFAGQLWLSLGYDREAYDEKVGLWWDEVVRETRNIT